MMLCFAYAATKSERFHIAYGRTLKDRQVLQSRFKGAEIGGRFNTLGFVISDNPSNYFKVASNVDDSIYQISVGYDLSGDYPREEDDMVIRMIANWLRRAFQETDGYAAKRTELLNVLDNWEEQTIRNLASVPTAGN